MHKIILYNQGGLADPGSPGTDEGGKASLGAQIKSQLGNLFSAGGSGWDTVTGIANNVFGSVSDAYGSQKLNESTKAARETIRSGLNMIPVVGPAINIASGAIDMLGSLTGTALDDVDKGAANRAGAKGLSAFNSAMNMLPGNSMLVGIWGKDAHTAQQASQEAMATIGGYGSAQGDKAAAESLSGSRIVGRKWRQKVNELIDDSNKQLELLDEIGRETKLRNQNDYAQALQSQNMRRYAGNQMMAAVGKKGTKLPSLKKIKKVEKVRQQIHDKYIEQLSSLSFPEPDLEIALRQIESNIDKFKEGGKFNMLAKGTYHCRNHHLEVKDSRFAEVTKKGIPVVVEDKNGNIIQTAEIEQNELIFNKEITDKIEALRKDGSDEAAIECGKLLVTQCTRHLRNKPKEDK